MIGRPASIARAPARSGGGFRLRAAIALSLALTVATLELGAPRALAADSPVGTWTGVILEPGANGNVDVWDDVIRFDDPTHIAIDYDGLDCGGTLTYLRNLGDISEYRETLTYGLDRCVDNGTVGLFLKADKLVWYWSGEGTADPTGMDVGVLSRK